MIQAQLDDNTSQTIETTLLWINKIGVFTCQNKNCVIFKYSELVVEKGLIGEALGRNRQCIFLARLLSVRSIENPGERSYLGMD